MTQPFSKITLSVCLHFRAAERWNLLNCGHADLREDKERHMNGQIERKEAKEEKPPEVEAAAAAAEAEAARETSGRLEADV